MEIGDWTLPRENSNMTIDAIRNISSLVYMHVIWPIPYAFHSLTTTSEGCYSCHHNLD